MSVEERKLENAVERAIKKTARPWNAAQRPEHRVVSERKRSMQ